MNLPIDFVHWKEIKFITINKEVKYIISLNIKRVLQKYEYIVKLITCSRRIKSMILPGFTANSSFITKGRYDSFRKPVNNMDELVVPAAARWGAPQRNDCTRTGIRQYSAVIHNVPSGMSWENACRNTPNTIDGQWFPGANRCINRITNMWGQFDVRDNSCGAPGGTNCRTYNGPCGTVSSTGRSCVEVFDPYSQTTIQKCCMAGNRWAWIKVCNNLPHQSGCGFPCFV